MGDPPLEAGSVQVTVTTPFDSLAVTPVGDDGAVLDGKPGRPVAPEQYWVMEPVCP